MKRRRYPIRLKLTLATILPLAAAIVLCWVIGISVINSRIVSQAQEKVRTDLNAARSVYDGELEHVREVIKFAAENQLSAATLERRGAASFGTMAQPLLRGERLDILTLVDARGRVVMRGHNPGPPGDDRLNDPLIASALKGNIVSATTLLHHEQLVREGNTLAGRAVIKLIPTQRARERGEKEERTGMFLMAAAPVRNGEGRIIGALYGGTMLNGKKELVDRIKQIVFEGLKFQERDVGTATIFLNDLRIATNVLLTDGSRALGTRLSEEVYRKVNLQRGKWVDRAFVVDDWYFSAYQPLLNLQGEVVGSLYVGMLEKPYVALKREFSLISAAVLLAGLLIGILLSGIVSSRMARPVKELETVARRIAAGERGLEIRAGTADEIGDLANEFAEMTRILSQREEDIGRLNRELELKVKERTAELEEKNLLLVKTQEELVRAGKLAGIGELAAGVAHEINNPMAIIRGNAELLQMAIPEEDENREEVDTILQQAGRVEKIVGNLLTFARQERKHLGKVDLPPLFREILDQIRHQVPLGQISVRLEHDPDLPEIQGDQDQLRQVFTNLIVNAIQAMDGNGVLSIGMNGPDEDGMCRMDICDTGEGIPVADREQVFDPFFTTKKQGTGLGLSVSYGIVKNHGGRIEMESEAGSGTRFTVLLPVGQNGIGM